MTDTRRANGDVTQFASGLYACKSFFHFVFPLVHIDEHRYIIFCTIHFFATSLSKLVEVNVVFFPA